MPYVLSCPTCLVPYVSSCPTCLVSYVLSCPTFLVFYVLLVPYVLLCPSCPTCSGALRDLVPCTICVLVPYIHRALMLSCLTCSHAIHALVPRALRVFVSHLFYVLWYLTCLTCSCTSRVFCLAFSWDARDSDSTGLVLLNFELFYRTIVSILFYKKSLTLKVT